MRNAYLFSAGLALGATLLFPGLGQAQAAPAVGPTRAAAPKYRFARGGAPRLRFAPRWKRFDGVNYALLAGAIVTSGVNLGIGGSPDRARRGGVLFDDGVRDHLRVSTRGGRQVVRDTSDFLLSLLVSYPFLVDSVVVAGWQHDSPEVGRQMALITAETLALTFAVQTTANVLTSRERPYGEDCGTDWPARSNDCLGQNRYESFFSGHTSQAVAAATVTCVHHWVLPLHGGGLADLLPCVGNLSLATATGVLRVAADQHYASDVGVGMLVGAGMGLAVPLLLHYRGGDVGGPTSLSVSLMPAPGGAKLAGTF